MKDKASKVLFTVFMIFFAMTVTILGRYIGTSIYQKNVLDTAQELIDVEVVGFLENIRYGLELGKDMDSYYNMDDILKNEIRKHDNVTDLYIHDWSYEVIYRTSPDSMPEDIESLEYGIIEKGNSFYSSRRINDDYYLVTVSNASLIKEMRGDYVSHITLLTFAGCPVVIILILVVMIAVREERKAWLTLLVIIGVWILTISVYSCYVNYRSFSDSLDRVERSVTGSFAEDVSYLESKGVDMRYVGDIDEYLDAYSDTISGVEDVKIDDSGEVSFVHSAAARSGIVFKYILQMLLMACFMFIVLWEIRIFMDEYSKTKKE